MHNFHVYLKQFSLGLIASEKSVFFGARDLINALENLLENVNENYKHLFLKIYKFFFECQK